MKEQIIHAIADALDQLSSEGKIQGEFSGDVQVTRSKDPAHGDFASNIALVFAKKIGLAPHQLAELLSIQLSSSVIFEKIEIAGPGFINFYIAQKNHTQVISTILSEQHNYGSNTNGAGKSIHLEYVSANPTGPLHVGHGRGAAYGATLANLYSVNGYQVHREYYVNDAGRQMDILATSVWLRYLELCGAEFTFPSNGYKGDYIWDIAATAHRSHSDTYFINPTSFNKQLPKDEPEGGDKETHIDALISIAKEKLQTQGYSVFFDLAIDTILSDIKDDLHLFGVDYEQWYSERSLFESNKINSVIEKLKTSNYIYEKNGALWFASSKLGDEKDRVVVRENGQPTYFASDIAYHADKFSKGYSQIINIWGADHHGYIARVRAALKALDLDDLKLNILLVQFANLYRGKVKQQMSTRSGEFVTLRELRKEVGSDAARFFYVMRKSEQHLDFDLELATSTSNENPMYYVQYAHARICSVLRQTQQTADNCDLADLESLLIEDSEYSLINKIADYPELIASACHKQAPHLLVNYLRELSQKFHGYYNETQFLVDSEQLRTSRLLLIKAIKQVLVNGLKILGVNAPDKM
ncbi:MAG: arginine--tRNA ligase [Gammaproteobacteria bacterium]|nr:arginine--tRNA ligase [Gammaproteobacteria bacterium]